MMTSEVGVEVERGWHRCYRMPDGRTHHPVGCAHESPREAIDHAESLSAHGVESSFDDGEMED